MTGSTTIACRLRTWAGCTSAGLFHLKGQGTSKNPQRALAYLLRTSWRDGRLLATSKDGRAHLPAYLDDYAFLVDALLALQARHDMMIMAKVDLSKSEPGHMVDLRDAGVAAAELTFADLEQVRRACKDAGATLACSAYTLNGVHCCGLHDAAALKNPDAVWGALLDTGVTILMTDEPAALAEYLDART